jgi:uncharacterized protein (DUF2336 family)
MEAEPEVLVALLQNRLARLTPAALRTCIDVAGREPGLQRPLASREDLPQEFVEAVYLVVSDALRAEIATRYSVDEVSLRRVIGAAVQESATPLPNGSVADAEMAALTRALQQSGALTGQFVARSVREGRAEMLEHAVSRIADIDIAHVRLALEKHGAWAAALCCRICDIPRRDFSDLVVRLVKAKRMPPVQSSAVERAAAQTFVAHSPASAADALRRIARAD